MTKQAEVGLTMSFNYGEKKKKNKQSGLQMIGDLTKVTKQETVLKQICFALVVQQTLLSPQRKRVWITRLSTLMGGKLLSEIVSFHGKKVHARIRNEY